MYSITDAELNQFNDTSQVMRRLMLEMLVASGGGHFGGSLSVIDILVALYGKILKYDPANPDWPDRDRLILSKGHASAALCPVLAHFGYFDESLLLTFNKLDSPFGMHPDMHKIPGCDMSTGSLGHGLAIGIGMALASKADHKNYRVYVILGDGECNEGSVWEAAMTASHYHLDNLIVIIDRNMVSLDGFTEEIMSLEPLSERWRSFGWHVAEMDGHNFKQIIEIIEETKQIRNQPSVIIAHTIKGKGISFMEGKHEYHYAYLAGEELELARNELGSMQA